MNDKVCLIIVTHKDFVPPKDDIYLPVCVGAHIDELKSKFQPDNCGNNISLCNDLYCELTALYWAWQNQKCDILGLVHYRRYFSSHKNTKGIYEILNRDEIEQYLLNYDVIVTKRKKYIQTVENHYINCIKSRRSANKIQLRLLKETIKDLCPEYLSSFDQVMNGHSAHMLNMFIMRKSLVDKYCEWLFPILFELQKRIKQKDIMYERIMGAFGEFLLDTWIITNHYRFTETYLYEPEKNTLKKVKWALKRKLLE